MKRFTLISDALPAAVATALSFALALTLVLGGSSLLPGCDVRNKGGAKAGSSASRTKCRSQRPPPLAAAALEEKTAALRRIKKSITRMEREGLGYLAVSHADGELLRAMVRAVKARKVVEVGTSTGYSGLWLLMGLSETDGKLTTFEFDPKRAGVARALFAEAGQAHRVTLIEGDAHKLVGQLKGPIDLLFLDADKKGYIDYLQQLLPKVRKGGLILAHNMVYPKPDPRFIKAITTDPQLGTLFLNMDGAGMAVTQKKP